VRPATVDDPVALTARRRAWYDGRMTVVLRVAPHYQTVGMRDTDRHVSVVLYSFRKVLIIGQSVDHNTE